MLSLFPIPMILGAIYLFRNRKKEHAIFLIPTITMSIIFTIWCTVGFPEWLAKISIFSMAGASRASLALGTLNIYILIYVLGNIKKDDKWMKWWIGLLLGIIASIFVMYMATTQLNLILAEPNKDYITPVKIAIASILFVPMFILVFNLNKPKCQTAFSIRLNHLTF